jgi:hypothetical protein
MQPRVPDAVQRVPGDAKHRPVRCAADPGPTLGKSAGLYRSRISAASLWCCAASGTSGTRALLRRHARPCRLRYATPASQRSARRSLGVAGCRASTSFLFVAGKGRGWPGHLARRRASRFCPAMTMGMQRATQRPGHDCPTGKSVLFSSKQTARERLRERRNHLRVNSDFANHFNLICPVQSQPQKHFAFHRAQIDVVRAIPASPRGAYRDRHDT